MYVLIPMWVRVERGTVSYPGAGEREKRHIVDGI